MPAWFDPKSHIAISAYCLPLTVHCFLVLLYALSSMLHACAIPRFHLLALNHKISLHFCFESDVESVTSKQRPLFLGEIYSTGAQRSSHRAGGQ
jgi:hypothetical protein